MTTEDEGGGGATAAPVVSDPHDRDAMREEVLDGLRQPQKRIASKYHYDARGSELFEEITRLDEYYLTRIERGLLQKWVPMWVAESAPLALVELGPGSAEKSRIVLDAIEERVPSSLYVPVDVSGEFLSETATRLRDEYAQLRVAIEVADITGDFELSVELPEPTWIAFLGSTIGNFEGERAVRLIERIARRMRPGDRFLLGADLRPGRHKSRERLELAYNDPAGVTEQFSLNVLRVLNRELGSDFDPEAFRYRSFYDEAKGRIETYLEATCDQTVHLGDGVEIHLAEGEPIRTEISTKYDRPTIEELFDAAGMAVDRWVEDGRGYYALVLGKLAAEE